VFRVPLTRKAEELGRRIVANMIMLGALTSISGVVSNEAMVQAVTDTLPERILALNVRALAKGFDLGRSARN
jgi:2-oxoglutarate ferredoxin oxidoreductase subunit gamma